MKILTGRFRNIKRLSLFFYQNNKKLIMSQSMIKENRTISKRQKNKMNRKGALSDISSDRLSSYYDSLTLRQMQILLPSVARFSLLIQSDPVLRLNWEHGISRCQRQLSGKTGNDVIQMINTACLTPPSYSNSELVGFPINSIFVEFMQNENGRSFFSDPRVNEQLKEILNDYQQMLLSPLSLEFMDEDQPNGWFCPEAREKIEYHQYICFPQQPHYGFRNWNDWFLRLFKPGVRPIGEGSPNGAHPDNIIVNSCESVPLALPLQPQNNVKKTDNFWLKDDVYSLSDMFAAAKYKKQHYVDLFEGGTVYQAFLSALFYHRWHAPVDGIIEDIYEIPGTYYLDQSQFIPYDEGSPNNSESFLSAVAARKVVVINANNKNIGKIAIIYIGMAEVSSCVTTVQVGDFVTKGQNIGHFEFGGSSHTIIFEKKANLIFNTELYSHANGEIEGMKQNLSSFLAEVVVPTAKL